MYICAHRHSYSCFTYPIKLFQEVPLLPVLADNRNNTMKNNVVVWWPHFHYCQLWTWRKVSEVHNIDKQYNWNLKWSNTLLYHTLHTTSCNTILLLHELYFVRVPRLLGENTFYEVYMLSKDLLNPGLSIWDVDIWDILWVHLQCFLKSCHSQI